MLTDQQIGQIKVRLEGAFKPLSCVVEVWDYKQKIRLEVFDHQNGGVIKIQEIVLRHLSDVGYLDDVIQHVRARVQARGFTLE